MKILKLLKMDVFKENGLKYLFYMLSLPGFTLLYPLCHFNLLLFERGVESLYPTPETTITQCNYTENEIK